MPGGPFDSASISPNFTTSQRVANDINVGGSGVNLGTYNPPTIGSQTASVIWPFAALAAALGFIAWLFRSKKKDS